MYYVQLWQAKLVIYMLKWPLELFIIFTICAAITFRTPQDYNHLVWLFLAPRLHFHTWCTFVGTFCLPDTFTLLLLRLKTVTKQQFYDSGEQTVYQSSDRHC